MGGTNILHVHVAYIKPSTCTYVCTYMYICIYNYVYIIVITIVHVQTYIPTKCYGMFQGILQDNVIVGEALTPAVL